MNFVDIIKIFILKITPNRLLQAFRKLYYIRKLKSYSEKDETDLEVIKHLVGSGDIVIDIGANIGLYTLFLSKYVGDRGHVYSIEPIPQTFEILSNNVKNLMPNNVTVYNFGISDKSGTAIMEIPKYNSNIENFYQATLVDSSKHKNSLRKITVNLISLDKLKSERKEKIAFIKIDAEGHEFEVLNGAKKIINLYKPALLVELSGNPDDDRSIAFNIFNQLKKEGYSSYWYDGTTLKLRSYNDKSINYFFLQNHHYSQYKGY